MKPEPQLFDSVELLVNLPVYSLSVGIQGAIVERQGKETYAVEFTTPEGEKIVPCTADQLMVIWCNATNAPPPISEQILAVIRHLSDIQRQEVLDFALSLCRCE